MPYNDRLFHIDFDFIAHLLVIKTTDGSTKTIPLRARSVADFYQETMAALGSLGMPVTVWTTPVEVQDRTPFELFTILHTKKISVDIGSYTVIPYHSYISAISSFI